MACFSHAGGPMRVLNWCCRSLCLLGYSSPRMLQHWRGCTCCCLILYKPGVSILAVPSCLSCAVFTTLGSGLSAENSWLQLRQDPRGIAGSKRVLGLSRWSQHVSDLGMPCMSCSLTNGGHALLHALCSPRGSACRNT